MLLWNRIQAAHRPSVSTVILSISQENLSWIPGQSTQYVDLTTHTEERISSHVIFLSSESFPQGTGPNLISCFPFYPILCGSFSQPWLYRKLSANFQLAVSDTCSMSRCIFDMFIGEGKFHILLLCHHDLLSWIHTYIYIYQKCVRITLLDLYCNMAIQLAVVRQQLLCFNGTWKFSFMQSSQFPIVFHSAHYIHAGYLGIS